MSENFGRSERTPVPREGEIMRVIEQLARGKSCREIIRHEDEKGLYRLIMEITGDDGDPVRFDFVRAGDYPEGQVSQTAIDIIYLNSFGDEVGGNCAARYINGAWIGEHN